MLESLQLPNKKQHLPSSESTIITSITSSPTARHVSIWPKSWGGSDLVAIRALPWAIGPTYTPKWKTVSATTVLVVLSRVVISPWRQFEAIFNLILLFSTCIAAWRMAEKKKRRSFPWGWIQWRKAATGDVWFVGEVILIHVFHVTVCLGVATSRTLCNLEVDNPISFINFGSWKKNAKQKALKKLIIRYSTVPVRGGNESQHAAFLASWCGQAPIPRGSCILKWPRRTLSGTRSICSKWKNLKEVNLQIQQEMFAKFKNLEIGWGFYGFLFLKQESTVRNNAHNFADNDGPMWPTLKDRNFTDNNSPYVSEFLRWWKRRHCSNAR